MNKDISTHHYVVHTPPFLTGGPSTAEILQKTQLYSSEYSCVAEVLLDPSGPGFPPPPQSPRPVASHDEGESFTVTNSDDERESIAVIKSKYKGPYMGCDFCKVVAAAYVFTATRQDGEHLLYHCCQRKKCLRLMNEESFADITDYFEAFEKSEDQCYNEYYNKYYNEYYNKYYDNSGGEYERTGGFLKNLRAKAGKFAARKAKEAKDFAKRKAKELKELGEKVVNEKNVLKVNRK
tara:strand:+ start:1720 stop:2427 length:708 start_codon:yes stop_codon:yes gene_type:complete